MIRFHHFAAASLKTEAWHCFDSEEYWCSNLWKDLGLLAEIEFIAINDRATLALFLTFTKFIFFAPLRFFASTNHQPRNLRSSKKHEKNKV